MSSPADATTTRVGDNDSVLADRSRTVAAFSARLRNEIDLDSPAELLAVVDQTMQPTGHPSGHGHQPTPGHPRDHPQMKRTSGENAGALGRGDQPIAKIAQALGISTQSIYTWHRS